MHADRMHIGSNWSCPHGICIELIWIKSELNQSTLEMVRMWNASRLDKFTSFVKINQHMSPYRIVMCVCVKPTVSICLVENVYHLYSNINLLDDKCTANRSSLLSFGPVISQLETSQKRWKEFYQLLPLAMSGIKY